MELASIMLVCSAAVFYIAAIVLYAYQMRMRTDKYSFALRVVTIMGLLCQTTLIGITASKHSGTQLAGANILMLASWTVMVAYFLFEVFSKRKSYGIFIIPIVLVSMLAAWSMGAGAAPPEGNAVYAQWPLLVVHIVAYFIAAAFFLLGGASAVMLLFQENRLKSKKVEVVESRMPGLSFLKSVMRCSVVIGLPLLILSLFLGTARATGLGLEMWWASPRIIMSVLVLIVYVVLLFQMYVAKASTNAIAKTHIVASIGVVVLTVFSAILPMLGN